MTTDYYLIDTSKEELTELVTKLLNRLSEKERLEFISQWISPQAALSDACAGDSNNFILKVETFCEDCREKEYYIEPDYEDYYYNYCGDYDYTIDYSDSRWAEKFEYFYKLAVMFSINNEFDVSLKAFDILFDCLNECEIDEEILGTMDPWAYIDVNWDIVYGEYYRTIAGYFKDKRQSAFKAIEIWISGSIKHSDKIFDYFTDLKAIEEAIRYNIKNNSDRWSMQQQLYELLKSFYIKQDEVFDKIEILESMLCYSKNFTDDLVQAYIGRQKWTAAIVVILPVLNVIDDNRILESLKVSLIKCYDKLKKYDKGLEVAIALFKKHPYNHDYYLKSRYFSIKTKPLECFIEEMTAFAMACDGYYSTELLLRILSYEGFTKDLVNTALKTDGSWRHDYLKYTFESLLFRAFKDKDRENVPEKLKALINGLEYNKAPGIADMLECSKSLESEEFLLQSAINILKEIIQFYIDAAKREGYASAAYYSSLLQGIYKYMNEENEFVDYYKAIMAENPRRRALKDEMRKALSI